MNCDYFYSVYKACMLSNSFEGSYPYYHCSQYYKKFRECEKKKSINK